MPVIIFINTFPWKTGNATFQLKAKQLIFWGGQNKAGTFWIKMTEGTHQQATNPKPICLYKSKFKMDSNGANPVL